MDLVSSRSTKFRSAYWSNGRDGSFVGFVAESDGSFSSSAFMFIV